MFHIAMWRERMRDALATTINGGRYELPGTRDEINETELADGIGTPLSDASARSGQLLSEIAQLLGEAGDRPINWFGERSCQDAVLRNSYSHPRRHICEYMAENGDIAGAARLVEDALTELGELPASDYVTGVLVELRDDPRLKGTLKS